MQYLRFNDLTDYIPLESWEVRPVNKNHIILIFSEEDNNLSLMDKGFKIYDKEIYEETITKEDETTEIVEKERYIQVADFSDYTLLYYQNGNEIWYTNNATEFNEYALYNDRNYVELITVCNAEYAEGFELPYIILSSGTLADVCEKETFAVDEEGYFKYKIVDGEMVPVDPDEKVKQEEDEEPVEE